ncbi:MAG: type II toxin-antitoxin system RelE/ParE family toxin [Planctomycetaceae bacterium]|nr:type II toxin-antitoxin system RelE/ParE family toxin [Planctomycetales bacterium]MCB9926651.1 type II toxin-antitoxin system RelE/ParE family toxin [Planctomycetaceae bacterium]
MTYRLNVTNKARDDITRNASWWAENHSLEEALKWHDAIYAQLDTLLSFPERHAVAPENDEFEYEIREKPIGVGPKPSYRAIFTIVDDEIRVLAVHRAAQDDVKPTDFD